MSKKNKSADRKRRRLERRAARQADSVMPPSGHAPGDLPQLDRFPRSAILPLPSPAETSPENPAAEATEDCTKLHGFLLDIRKEIAAQRLAEGDVSAVEIARALGVSVRTVFYWKAEPEFAACVEENKARLASIERRRLLSRKAHRIDRLCEEYDSLQRIVDERSVDPAMKDVPGGDTGRLVRRERAIGSGPFTRFIVEHELDVGLCREQRAILQDIAEECGQRVTKIAPTTPDGTHEYTGVPAPSLEEFERLPLEERIRILTQPILPPHAADRGPGPPAS